MSIVGSLPRLAHRKEVKEFIHLVCRSTVITGGGGGGVMAAGARGGPGKTGEDIPVEKGFVKY